MAQSQKGSGAKSRTTASAMRSKGITILRSPAIAHMAELMNYGSTSNRRFRIRRK